MSKSISIITITKNNAIGLESTLQSILSQKCKDFELIVIDGASNDSTPQIIQKYSSAIDTWVSEQDDGISDAYNKGIGFARGRYLYFLNGGDTFYDCNSIGEANRYLIKYIERDLVFFKVIVDKDIEIPSLKYKGNVRRIIKDVQIPHQGAFIKNEVARMYRFDKRYKIRMDFDFYLRLLKSNCSYEFIDRPICMYQKGGISMKKQNRYSFYHEEHLIRKENGVSVPPMLIAKILLYYASAYWRKKS